MKLPELNLLIDAYQDGDIRKEDAIRLAALIRSGGAQSNWVMRELEMRGLITHIFDETSSGKFVETLMSRFQAEKEGVDFEKSFEKRLEKAQRSRPKGNLESLQRALNTVGTAAEADGRRDHKYNSKAGWWLVAVVVILIIVMFFNINLFHQKVGVLQVAAKGLRLHRDNRETKLQLPMELFEGDRLSLMGQGKAFFELNNFIKVEMSDETSLVLELKGDAKLKPEFSKSQSLYLERGRLKLSHIDKGDLVVWTPHALIKIDSGECEVLASDLSTMFNLSDVNVILSTVTGMQNKTYQGSYTILINDAGQVEEHLGIGESK